MRHFLLLASACLAVSGCVWPGWKFPDAQTMYSESTKARATKSCGENLPVATKCARYLIGELSKLEVDSGRWDTMYSLGMVGLGTVGAIYLKSDKDRTQAIEDLAVGVAMITGIRSVLRPEERRKVAREGREAVECMLAAAEGLKRVTGNPDASGASTSGVVSAATIATSRTKAFKAFEEAVTREFELGPNADGTVPAANRGKIITGSLLLARGRELKAAQEKTQAEAEIAQDNAAAKLGFGVTQVLHNVRSALSEPALSVANIVKTQRDQVQSMIADLSKSIEQENDEAKKAEGAAAVVPPTPDTQAAAPVLPSTPNAAGKRQLQTIYASCAGSSE